MRAVVCRPPHCRYDGQTFVKPPEVLTRDRLLGMYEVKPVLSKLRTTLLGSGAALMACVLVLATVLAVDTPPADQAPAPRKYTDAGVVYSQKVSDLSQLLSDDVLAEEEAKAQVTMMRRGAAAAVAARAADGAQQNSLSSGDELEAMLGDYCAPGGGAGATTPEAAAEREAFCRMHGGGGFGGS